MDPKKSLKEINGAIKVSEGRIAAAEAAATEKRERIKMLEGEIEDLHKGIEVDVAEADAALKKLKKQSIKKGKLEALLEAMAALMDDDSDSDAEAEDDAVDADEGSVEEAETAVENDVVEDVEEVPAVNAVAEDDAGDDAGEEDVEEEDDPDIDEADEQTTKEGVVFLFNSTSLNLQALDEDEVATPLGKARPKERPLTAFKRLSKSA